MSAREFYSSIEQQIQQLFALNLVHFLSFSSPDDPNLATSLITLLSHLKLFTPNGYIQYQSQTNKKSISPPRTTNPQQTSSLIDSNSQPPPPPLTTHPDIPSKDISPFVSYVLSNIPPTLDFSTTSTVATLSPQFKIVFYALAAYLISSPQIVQTKSSVRAFLAAHNISTQSPASLSDDFNQDVDPFGQDNKSDPYGTLISTDPALDPTGNPNALARYQNLPLNHIFEHVGLNQRGITNIRNQLLKSIVDHQADFSALFHTLNPVSDGPNSDSTPLGTQEEGEEEEQNRVAFEQMKTHMESFLELNGLDILPVLPALCTHHALLPIFVHKLIHIASNYQQAFPQQSSSTRPATTAQTPGTPRNDTMFRHLYDWLATSSVAKSNKLDEFQPVLFFEMFTQRFSNHLANKPRGETEDESLVPCSPTSSKPTAINLPLTTLDNDNQTSFFSRFGEYFYQTDISSPTFHTSFPVQCNELLHQFPQLTLSQSPPDSAPPIKSEPDQQPLNNDSKPNLSSNPTQYTTYPPVLTSLNKSLHLLNAAVQPNVVHPLHSNFGFLISALSFQFIKSHITINPKEALLSLFFSNSEIKQSFVDVMSHFLEPFTPQQQQPSSTQTGPLLGQPIGTDTSNTDITRKIPQEVVTFLEQKKQILNFYLNMLYTHHQRQSPEFAQSDQSISPLNIESSPELSPPLPSLINPTPREYHILQSQTADQNAQQQQQQQQQQPSTTQPMTTRSDIYNSRINLFENRTVIPPHPLTALYSIYTQYLSSMFATYFAVTHLQQRTCHYKARLASLCRPTDQSTPPSTEPCKCRPCRAFDSQFHQFEQMLYSFFITSLDFLHCISRVETFLNEQWAQYIPSSANPFTEQERANCGLFHSHPHLSPFLQLHSHVLNTIPKTLSQQFSSDDHTAVTNPRNHVELILFLFFYLYSVQFK